MFDFSRLLAASLVWIAAPAWAEPAAPAAEAGDAPVPHTRAKADLGGLIKDADYPAAALRAGQEGTVAFRLHIAETGAVSRCEIVTSSGSAALDETTCHIMTTRPKFTPALDAEGKPTTDTVHAQIVWNIAEPALPAEPPAVRAKARSNLAEMISDGDYPEAALEAGEEGVVVFGVLIDETGAVADCGILETSGSAALDAATCNILRTRARFEPARDAHGKPVKDFATARIFWRIAAPPPPDEGGD